MDCLEVEIKYKYLTHLKACLSQRNLKILLCCFLKMVSESFWKEFWEIQTVRIPVTSDIVPLNDSGEIAHRLHVLEKQ